MKKSGISLLLRGEIVVPNRKSMPLGGEEDAEVAAIDRLIDAVVDDGVVVARLYGLLTQS